MSHEMMSRSKTHFSVMHSCNLTTFTSIVQHWNDPEEASNTSKLGPEHIVAHQESNLRLWRLINVTHTPSACIAIKEVKGTIYGYFQAYVNGLNHICLVVCPITPASKRHHHSFIHCSLKPLKELLAKVVFRDGQHPGNLKWPDWSETPRLEILTRNDEVKIQVVVRWNICILSGVVFQSWRKITFIL